MLRGGRTYTLVEMWYDVRCYTIRNEAQSFSCCRCYSTTKEVVCMCRYSIATLMAAKHDYELRADEFTHLHLDYRHMGVGGDDSWSPSLHKVLCICMLLTFCKILLLAGFEAARLAVKAPVPLQEYAVEPGEYTFSILLAPVLPSKDCTPPEAAASLWRQHCQ